MIILSYFIQSRKEAKQVFKCITSDNTKISEEAGRSILFAILDDSGDYKGRIAFYTCWNSLDDEPRRKGAAVVSMNSSSYFIPNTNNTSEIYNV